MWTHLSGLLATSNRPSLHEANPYTPTPYLFLLLQHLLSCPFLPQQIPVEPGPWDVANLTSQEDTVEEEQEGMACGSRMQLPLPKIDLELQIFCYYHRESARGSRVYICGALESAK